MQQTRLERTSSSLLRAAVKSAMSGATHQYLTGEKAEAGMRTRFAALAAALNTTDGPEEALSLFRHLDRLYKASRFCPAELYPIACQSVLDAVRHKIECQSRLLDQKAGHVTPIVAILSQILSRIEANRGTIRRYNPFSHITKYLHFIFPEQFVIWDNNAAMSVRMWSLFAIGDDDPTCRRFLGDRLWQRNGTAYQSMIDFYRLLWHSSTDDERQSLQDVASQLQDRLRATSDGHLAHVTVLDVIDKHLWISNGNPIRLGIASIP